MYQPLFLLLFLCWLALPAQAIEANAKNRQDTIRLKRILYDTTLRHAKEQLAYYTVEGDTMRKELTPRNLLKDIPLKKYKKDIRKVRRLAFWQNALPVILVLGVPAGLLVGLILFAIFTSLVVSFWVATLIVLGAVAIGWVSLYIGIILAFGMNDKRFSLMHIVDEYNKEVKAKK